LEVLKKDGFHHPCVLMKLPNHKGIVPFFIPNDSKSSMKKAWHEIPNYVRLFNAEAVFTIGEAWYHNISDKKNDQPIIPNREPTGEILRVSVVSRTLEKYTLIAHFKRDGEKIEVLSIKEVDVLSDWYKIFEFAFRSI